MSGGIDWPEIYGLLATACGWDFRTIDALTFADFSLLTRYWRDHPPPHLLLAASLGIKPPARSRSVEDLLSVFGALGGTIRP